MNERETFEYLLPLDLGISLQEKADLARFLNEDKKPSKPQKFDADPAYHQPVYSMMDRPYGIAAGFRIMDSCQRDDFDVDLSEYA